MLTNLLKMRVVARSAVVALALGLFALAGLQYVSTEQSARATAQLGEMNEIGAQWGALFEKLNLQDRAMKDFAGATDDIGREGLKFAIDPATSELSWLREHTDGAERQNVDLVIESYRSYVQTLDRMVAQGSRGDRRAITRGGAMSGLLADTLRAQINKNMVHWRLMTTDFLQRVERENRSLRMASTAVFVVDVILLLLCSMVLLSHQRRIERQAADSRYEALHDALTGLPNRVLLNDRLTQAVRDVDQDGAAVALLLIDLDRFKEINDTLGHHVGDLLLEEVSRRLAGAVRAGDTVARLGGDEFAVLLPAMGVAADADRFAKRILQTLQQPASLDGIMVDVDASIGVALFPTHSGDAHQLLQHADIAMYVAKRGHLGTAVYSPDGAEKPVGQPAVIGDFRQAMDPDDLVPGGVGALAGPGQRAAAHR